MSDRIEGSCHCGGVKVSLPDDAFGVVACHCGDCQKLHGNFFAMLVADRDAVRIDGTVEWYASSEKARRAFCRTCGSRVAKDAHGSPKLLVSVGLFPRDLERRIEKHVMPESKPRWYEIA